MSLLARIKLRLDRSQQILRKRGVKGLIEESSFFILRRLPLLQDYAKVIERDYKDYIKLPWGNYSHFDYLTLEAKFLYGLIRGENYSLQKSVRKFEDIRKDKDKVSAVYLYEGYGRFHSLRPMQISSEIKDLTNLLEREKVESILEIGSARNGTLAIWSNFAKKLYSVDLPESDQRRTTLDKASFLRSVFESSDFMFIRGNSHDENIKRKLGAAESETLDFIFIDGDHTYEGVKEDFNSYKKLLGPNGIIAFHDIKNERFGVSNFWDEVKENYKTKEFIDDEIDDTQGVGVLYL